MLNEQISFEEGHGVIKTSYFYIISIISEMDQLEANSQNIASLSFKQGYNSFGILFQIQFSFSSFSHYLLVSIYF